MKSLIPIWRKVLCLPIVIILLCSNINICRGQKLFVLNNGRDTSYFYTGAKSDSVFFPEEKRFALVIGEINYKSLDPIAQCKNDADSITAELRHAGFDVLKILDKSKASLDSIIGYALHYYRDSNYNVALFYYSGHGAQVKHVTESQILLPIDYKPIDSKSTRCDRITNYRNNALVLSEILDSFKSEKTQYVLSITDACRSEDKQFELPKDETFPCPSLGRSTLYDEKIDCIFSAVNTENSSVGHADTNSIFTSCLIHEFKKKPTSIFALFHNLESSLAKKQIPVRHHDAPSTFNFYQHSDYNFSNVVPPKDIIPAPKLRINLLPDVNLNVFAKGLFAFSSIGIEFIPNIPKLKKYGNLSFGMSGGYIWSGRESIPYSFLGYPYDSIFKIHNGIISFFVKYNIALLKSKWSFYAGLTGGFSLGLRGNDLGLGYAGALVGIQYIFTKYFGIGAELGGGLEQHSVPNKVFGILTNSNIVPKKEINGFGLFNFKIIIPIK